MKHIFTAKTFDELTEGMSVSEKTAIKQGIIVDGMSKEAVLVSYGPPSTGDQKADTKPDTLEDKLVQLKQLLDTLF